jgi:MoaA/NifB/PqqE/SkfB family radical SAM enzyme
LATPHSSAVQHADLLDQFRGDSIDVYINQDCNIRCRTCFLGDGYFATSNDMTSETFAAILLWATAQGVRDVALLGGEPTLHPHLSDLIDTARGAGVDNVRLVSNGTAPFRRFLAEATALPDTVYLSLDGTSPAQNDAVRGQGTFDQVMRAIDLLERRAIPYVLTSTLTVDSVNSISDLVRFAEATSCVVLNVHWLSPIGRARNEASLPVPYEAWSRAVEFVRTYVPSRASLQVRIQEAFARSTAPNASACAVREHSNLQFFPNGAVYACGILVADAGLNGYAWDPQRGPRERQGRTELEICSQESAGCPVRLAGLVRVAADRDLPPGIVPSCIYNRVEDASH